eukprot:799508-Pyramimonas_sp.AAC.1
MPPPLCWLIERAPLACVQTGVWNFGEAVLQGNGFFPRHPPRRPCGTDHFSVRQLRGHRIQCTSQPYRVPSKSLWGLQLPADSVSDVRIRKN